MERPRPWPSFETPGPCGTRLLRMRAVSEATRARHHLLLLPAAADLLFLALVLHLGDRAQHFEAELAVGLLVDLHGALVLDDVARARIDHHCAARAVDGD